ncbi:hypothetical protein [Phenylobacterium sp. J367]|uniref:hypothetical protein n=1 Tax=Phenylobacterium sp. J367 TaxID=2898435 RepID=UPI00215160F1|nr:hypothetical protein [Phenylobacterium sp. J367]MCR5879096.1 hypothetical protein [Phenylobacterium sp. J367]
MTTLLRTRIAALTAALCLAVPGAALAQTTAEDDFAVLAKTAQSGNGCDKESFAALLDRRDFRTLTSQQRSWTYMMAAMCGIEPTAELVRKSTAEKEASALAWTTRFIVASEIGDVNDGLRSLEEAAKRRGDGSAIIFSDSSLFDFARLVRDDPKRKRRFLAALDTIDWKPMSPFAGGDYLWVDYARMLKVDGDLANARRVAGRVRSVSSHIELRLNNDYAGLTEDGLAQFDSKAIAEAEFARAREALDKDPDDGRGVLAVAADLRLLGRSEEALKLLEARLAKPGPIPDAEGGGHPQLGAERQGLCPARPGPDGRGRRDDGRGREAEGRPERDERQPEHQSGRHPERRRPA